MKRARWKREDVAHQRSRRIVNACDVLALEELNVTRMVQNRYLATSIHDAAWRQCAGIDRR